MRVTSAQANKMLKKVTEEYETLMLRESQTTDFLATQEALEAYEKKIRKMKHAINVFNTTTVVEGFGVTVDEMLVLILQLTKQKAKLAEMKGRLPKMREKQSGYMQNAVIDYRYVNYDVDEVEAKYAEVAELLSKARLALDNVNSTVEFDFENVREQYGTIEDKLYAFEPQIFCFDYDKAYEAFRAAVNDSVEGVRLILNNRCPEYLKPFENDLNTKTPFSDNSKSLYKDHDLLWRYEENEEGAKWQLFWDSYSGAWYSCSQMLPVRKSTV